MNIALPTIPRCAVQLAVFAFSLSAFAHVSLQQPSAETGSAYRAVMRVGHGCDGAATTAIAVQLPAGFSDVQPNPKAGWTLSRQGAEVRWTVDSKQSALVNGTTGEFVMHGRAPSTPGPLWFKVRQVCEQGRIDWAQVPAAGTSTEGMKTPAALLQVQAPALVKVEEAWVRPSVVGQQGSGGYMKLTARQGLRLVGAVSTVAGVAEVHEMKMDGDVMRMRPVPFLDLAAGQTVELKPGGLHLMLMDLKQPLVAGSTVPLTLVFKDARGAENRVETRLQVTATAPAGGPPADAHKH